MRRAAVICGLAALLGCRGAEETEARVDDAVRFVAVLAEDGAGSEIAEWPPGAPLPLVTSGEGPHTVFGYDAAQLSPFGEAWRQGRLRAAATCEARLPAPRWAGQLLFGGLTAVDPAALPAVTVEGLTSACPAPGAVSLALDVRGRTERCPHQVTRSGCAVTIEPECELGELQGYLHPDGGFCLELSPGPWRCRGEVVGRDAPLECLEPALEVGVVAVEPAEPPFDSETVSLVDRAPALPRLWATLNQLYSWNLRAGLAFSMAVLEDHVVVSYTQAGPGGDCAADENVPTGFAFVDRDTAQVVGRRDAPRCATELRPEAGGQSFVGVYIDDTERYRLARFASDGALAADAPMPGTSRWDPPPRDPLFVPGADRILLFMPLASSNDAVVYAHRASDLAFVRTATLTGADDVTGAGFVDDDTVFVGFGEDHFLYLDARTLEVAARGAHPEQNLYPTRFVSHLSVPGSAAVLTNGPPNPSLVRFVRGEPLGRIRVPLDPGFVPSALVSWPGGRWLVGGAQTEDTARPSAFSMYDADGDRFLPGTWTLDAPGAVSRMEWDADGRLWVLHPWAGQVSRLTPR